MKKRMIPSYLYYLAAILSIIGISTSFLQIPGNSIFLQGGVVLIGVYFIVSAFFSKLNVSTLEFSFVILLLTGAFVVAVKLACGENLLLPGPLMGVACFLILMAILLYAFHFCHWIYMGINTLGATLLIVGVLTKSFVYQDILLIGYINPQTLGSWALMYAIGAFLCFDFYLDGLQKRKPYKGVYITCLILQVLIYGFMVYITWVTSSRFAMLLTLVLIVLRFLPVFSFMNCKWVRIPLAFIPLIFFGLAEILNVTHLFAFMKGGTLLNGRESIWMHWMEKAIQSPIWGLSYRDEEVISIYSHNVFVDFSVLFGMLFALIFFASLAIIFVKKVPSFIYQNENGDKVKDRIRYDAFMAFLIVLVASCVEGCFFIGGAGGLFIFSMMPLLIAISEKEKTPKQEEV